MVERLGQIAGGPFMPSSPNLMFGAAIAVLIAIALVLFSPSEEPAANSQQVQLTLAPLAIQ
jgi:hypothetical protein